MAIYHFSGQVISRSQGRSVIAAAAYRSASIMRDETYGQSFDYTNKNHVVHTEILLPDGAPEWMADREVLWNAVEKNENRKDAQLAREFVATLPKELSLTQNIALIREFVMTEFVKLGMIADVCIHNETDKNGEPQPHAHIMLTMREVTPNGFGQKVREWNQKPLLERWRQSWAEFANLHLAKHDFNIRIDHRSFADQGIDLLPQNKIGTPSARKYFHNKVMEHAEIVKENGRRLLNNPLIALDALTKQQSTFTKNELVCFIARHTVDQEQFNTVYAKLLASPELKSVGIDAKGLERFTSLELSNLENTMLTNAEKMAKTACFSIPTHAREKAAKKKNLTLEQKKVLDFITDPGSLKCVIGYAGSGKSYLLGAARQAWEAKEYNVQGITLAGIAAENLEASSGIASRTFASRCWYWDRGEQKLTNKDILVVDEAGMLGSRQVARILTEAKAAGAKVILIGDTQQLQAIEAGAAFRAISEKIPTIELTEIWRQKDEWQRNATRDFANGYVAKALAAYHKHDHLHKYDSDHDAREALIAQWQDVRATSPKTTQIILSYKRSDVAELNKLARNLRKSLGELKKDVIVSTALGKKAFAVGERLYFLENNQTLGVKNGTLGTLLDINRHILKGHTLKIQLDGNGSDKPRIITIDTWEYNHLTHGYAATIHKGQGVTVDRAYLYASKAIDAHAAYVGMSRHRYSVDVFWSKSEFATYHDLTKQFSRQRQKDVSLDYGVLAKEQREFNKEYSVPNSPAVKNPTQEHTLLSNEFDWGDSQIGKELATLAQHTQSAVVKNMLKLYQIGANNGFDSILVKTLNDSLSRINDNPVIRKLLTEKTTLLYHEAVEKENHIDWSSPQIGSNLKTLLQHNDSQLIKNMLKLHDIGMNKGFDSTLLKTLNASLAKLNSNPLNRQFMTKKKIFLLQQKLEGVFHSYES